MGVVETLEKQTNFCGGIDFGHLRRVKIGELKGARIAAFQFIIRQSVLNRVRVHGDSSPRAEICGVLVGDVYRDEIGAFALIEHVIEGQSSTSSAGQVTFTADTWQHIQVLMDKQYPDLRIVGWYHTHPGHGIFLSDMDIFLHESFFGLPWQCALVYDPRSGEQGIFNAPQGKSEHLEFVIEADEAALADRSRSADSHTAVPAAPPEAPTPAGKGGKYPPSYPPKNRFWSLIGRFFLAIIGLLLFTCMGALLGLLIRVQHISLPYWIQRMAGG
jgi:proteasome lid subunit RPN8/RPN11